MKYFGQINRGMGWITIAQSDIYTSAKNIANDYAIEHDCDYRVIRSDGSTRCDEAR